MSHLESICRERAARTSAIVSSIFPGEFRDEMIENQKLSTEKEPKAHAFLAAASHAGIEEGHEKDHLPLAKYYTDVTVMFADIVGFTAWASSKEAPQVFELLETVYNAFDDIATVSLPLSWILCFKNTLTSLLHCVIGTKSLQGRDSRRLLRCCRWHPESPTTSCSCHV